MYDAIVSWDNLWLAYRKAAKGKRGSAAAAGFEHQVADNLLALQAELVDGRYRPGTWGLRNHLFAHHPLPRRP